MQQWPILSVQLTEGFGRGGGLTIIMDKNYSTNIIDIINCSFTENSAIWGGAVYIAIQEKSHDNTVNLYLPEYVH